MSPGEAHQLHDTGDSDLIVRIIADSPAFDLRYYAVSETCSIPGALFRVQETAGYYDREE